MKRSNFTFLFLFALLSFVSVNLGAQGSSCIDKVNIRVDANCGWHVDKERLGYTGTEMPQSIIYTGTGSGTPFPGTGSLTGPATGSMGPGIGLPDGGMVQYQLWSGPNGTGTMLCWGNINFEIKMTPPTETSTQMFMCGQPFPKIPEYKAGPCQADIYNITASERTEGNVCSGLQTIRTITGVTDIHGKKQTITLRIDTFIQTPLDTSMVTCPMGGPDFTNALKLRCEVLDGEYPSPDVVYDYFYALYRAQGRKVAAAENLAIQKAYPYVSKGIVPDSVINRITRNITSTVVPTKILLNGLWVIVDVVVKDTTYDTFYRDASYPLAIPLPKGVTCNLSVKCTDWQFPGCAGPDAKIMRQWQILDWCNGSVKECTQWIVVEPDDPYFTKVLGKKVTKNRDGSVDFYKMWPNKIVPVPIAPWTCAAQLQLSAMVDWSCIEDGEIAWSTTAGSIGKDLVLRGLWLGEDAVVTATLLGCHSLANPVTFTFTARPFNSIYPVPVAEDKVNVSLTGDPTGTVSPDGGVAKVFVNAIDAGSHNAGCGPVYSCLLLKEELENPVIIGGVHVSVNGKLIYHAAQCLADGVLKGKPATKLTPAIPDIPYVYCKEYVKFCCSDIGENQVALLVTNEGGRTAHSWSTVWVEDKSNPVIICRDGAIDCTDEFDPNDFKPHVREGICSDYPLDYTVVEDLDACGEGYYTIIWTNADGEVVCESDVYVRGQNNFNPYEIKWPKHYTGEYEIGVVRECELWLDADGDPVLDSKGNEQYRIVEYTGRVYMGDAFDCAEGGDTGEPVWCQAECSLVGSTFEPLEVEAADACKKIIRRWTVIDWCYWDPNTTNPDDDNDTATDNFQAVDDEWLDAYDPDQAGKWFTDWRQRYAPPAPVNYPDGIGEVTKLECEACDKTNAEADYVYFRYTSVDEDGYYTFDQVIKVIDEDAPVVDADDFVTISVTGGAQAKGDDYDDCYASEDIPASVTDMCGETDLATEGAAWWIEVYVSNEDGDKVALAKTATKFGTNVTMNSQKGTPGTYHLIVWSVRDGCGNVGTKETLIYFQDDKQPTPVCIQDLSTAIMPTSGSVEIWASDYDNGSFDNCSDVYLWFLLDSLGNPTDDLENGTLSANLNVTCDMLSELGQGETLVLGLYVTDAGDNIDFCNITLNVNGAAEVCDLNSTAAVIGGIVSLHGTEDRVESAEIALNVGAKDLTGVEGTYAFNGNAMFQSYEIAAKKNDDPLNGVTTLDLVLIQKHILRLQTLDDPYKIIAADINGNGRVAATDLADLRRLILGIISEFPSNDSWRFIDATQTFDDPENPFPFTEILSISSLGKNELDQNFIGVKIGDVNGNAIANSLISAGSRSVGRLALNIEDQSVNAGELIDVAIGSSNFDAITAYQFTMELSGLEFVGATSGAIEVSDVNFGRIDARTVTTAWHTPEGISTGDDLFTMTFRATESIELSEALAISSRITQAAAYNTNEDRLDVALEFNTIGEAGFVLLQNNPNPFDKVTRIGFELPVAGAATLTVFDVTGKTVSVMTETYNAGYNEITLTKNDLGTSGVLYYQLESGDFTATKKMILID